MIAEHMVAEVEAQQLASDAAAAQVWKGARGRPPAATHGEADERPGAARAQRRPAVGRDRSAVCSLQDETRSR